MANSQRRKCLLIWEGRERETFPLLYLHKKLQVALFICVNNKLRTVRTLTSSLFSALKFIEKRHCFSKIALAVISGSVHCWGNRKRVEVDIRGLETSCAYHQRTSCSAGSSSQQVLNASFQTWVRNSSHLLAF